MGKLAYLALVTTTPILQPRPATLASAVLELAAAALMSLLALLERRRTRYPSDLLCVFLAITIILDSARCRTLWLLVRLDSQATGAAASFTVSLAIKAALLFLVSQRESPEPVFPGSSSQCPDNSAGLFSISCYWWLNPLVRLGYSRVLGLDDLYSLPAALACPQHAPGATERDSQSEEPAAVLKLVVQATGWTVLYPTLPRLCLIGFTVAQASLTRGILALLSEPDGFDLDAEYGLILATFLVYLGIAMSTAWTGYLHERVLTRLRGSLIRSIYLHSTRMSAGSACTAKPSTLISVDVETVYNGLRNVHELWALPVQVAVAAWMAYRELGMASLAAIALIAATCVGVAAVSPLTVARQRAWMATLQSRIGKTSAVLGSMKTLKSSGLSRRIQAMLEKARADELHVGSYFRLVMSLSSTISQLPFVAAPVIVFATGPHPLDATIAFTALSYLSIMTQPLMTAIQVLPVALASHVCLQRIQQFLSSPGHVDKRVLGPTAHEAPDSEKADRSEHENLTVRISGASFSWTSGTKPVLRHVDVEVPSSTFAAITGPVGCGKSTMLHAVLGEITPSPGGLVAVNTSRVAFCAQSPVLCDGTVRENIIGPMPFNKARYREVLDATALTADMAQLPQGDATRLETRGETLSGGQRQRVALARALYHEPRLILVDDVLSSLDKRTGLAVACQVFGPDGILRKRGVTVLFSTNSASVAELADRCIEISSEGEVTQRLTPQSPPPSLPSFLDNEKKDKGFEGSAFTLGWNETNTADDGTPSGTPNREERKKEVQKASDAKTWISYFARVGVLPNCLFAFSVLGFGFTMVYPTIWVEMWTADTSSQHSFAYWLGIYGALAASCLVASTAMGLVVLVLFVRRAGAAMHHGALSTAMGATLRYLMQTSVGTTLTHFSQDLAIVDGQLAGTLVNLAATATVACGQAVLLAVSTPWLAVGFPVTVAVLYLTARLYVPTSVQLRGLDLEAKGPLVAHALSTMSTLATIRAFGWLSHEADRNKVLLERSQRPSYFLGMAQQWLVLVNNLVVVALATGLVALATLLHPGAGTVGIGLVSLIALGRNLADMVRAYTMVEIALGAVARLTAFVRDTPRERKCAAPVAMGEAWPAGGAIRIDNVSASYDASSDGQSRALCDIRLEVAPGEKVALYGRTGRQVSPLLRTSSSHSDSRPSGKSSLLLMLLGMLEPLPRCASKISIDNISIDQLDGGTLRERVIAMPQDAVFLPDGASVRDNLDPLGQASSEACHYALGLVGLSSRLSDLDAALNLKALSDGSRQLFCLARCVVRRRVRLERHGVDGGLLLLDEISAHVDDETAKTMLGVVEREFVHYTVLAVTHRLLRPATFQRAVVMEGGRLIEDANAGELLRDKQSHLAALHAHS